MPDYSKSKIYRIICNKTGLVYIGSTTTKLSQRLTEHKAQYIRFKNDKIKRKASAIEIIENDDYSIFLIEDYPCERKEQLLKREREIIENINCINKKRPIVSKEEIKIEKKQKYQNNEEYRKYQKENNKKWYEENKIKIREYTKMKMRRLREKWKQEAFIVPSA